MNIKSIPASQGVSTIKDSADESRQTPNQESKDEKNPKAKSAQEPTAELLSPEAGDLSLRQSQPVDSQTLVELLTHAPKKSARAKFPTPPRTDAAAASAKKLNRSA